MALEIGHELEPEQILSTIKNIENSSNELVKKVLAEETTYEKECKKLETYAEEEFYQRRDELVDALNRYEFKGLVHEEQKRLLEYKLLHKELKILEKKKIKKKAATFSLVPGTGGLTFLAYMFDPILAVGVGLASIYIGCILGYIVGDGISKINKREPLNESIALRTYHKLLNKSKDADSFMKDLPFLKENYMPLLNKGHY